MELSFTDVSWGTPGLPGTAAHQKNRLALNISFQLGRLCCDKVIQNHFFNNQFLSVTKKDNSNRNINAYWIDNYDLITYYVCYTTTDDTKIDKANKKNVYD